MTYPPPGPDDGQAGHSGPLPPPDPWAQHPGAPASGYSGQPGAPVSGYPGQPVSGYPPAQYPPAEYPPAQMPQSEYPPTGYQQTGYQPAAGYPPAPQWPAQGPPAPASRSSNPLPWILGGVGALVLLLVAGCVFGVVMLSGDEDEPTTTAGTSEPTRPGGTGGTPRASASSRSAAATGTMYKVAEDYCGTLDFSTLGPWATTKQKSEPRRGATGLADSYKITCTTDFRNGGPGKFSTVIVTAEIYGSVAGAQRAYGYHKDFDKSRLDKDLTGYGDEAYGTYRTWTPGFETSEYEVNLRSGNMVLSTHVSVSQDSFIPKEQMEPKVGAQAKAALALVPKA